ncbi:MAG: ShlB/FhaC/HecB family hemolysin secretion/activation protein [Candidatus Methylacidiphilales bacterium]|nr:ShlB/FhaC/HecB family hemolysin secretion/activation protein [Candidatus Methylacidiphilales bacterium]
MRGNAHPARSIAFGAISRPAIRACLLAAISGLLLSISLSSSMAQVYERYRPKVPQKPGDSATPNLPLDGLDDKPEKSTEPDTGPPIKGLVIVADPKAVKMSGTPKSKGVQISGLGAIDADAVADLRKKLEPFIGKPLNIARLRVVTNTIVRFYRDKNLPVTDASLPPQEVKGEVVQILVLEGRLGTVRAEGNKWFNSKMLENQIRIKSGSYIRGDTLQADINWLNSNPFREVEPSVSKGANFGETDLILKTKDRFPVRFYAGFEDTGTDLTGDERYITGFNWGNVFGLDHQFNYQFTTSGDFNLLTAHSASYLAPLPWRHKLLLYGTYAESGSDSPDPSLDINGITWQAGGRYIIPLPNLVRNFQHEVQLGFDFKQTNNDLDFGGENVFDTTIDVTEFVFTYNASYTDPYGISSLSANVLYSPGGLTDNSNDKQYQETRAGADADFAYAKFNLSRNTRLPWNFSFITSATWQVASGNLVQIEQLGLGGFNTVRGYDEREANGDEGWIVNLELRSPPISPLRLCGVKGVQDQLQFLAFMDMGSVSNIELLPGEDPHIDERSVGVGVRYTVNPYLSLRFDYGWQMIDTGLQTRNPDGRGHLGVVFSY